MNSKAYWQDMGSDGTRIAPDSARQPISADTIAQAERDLEMIAARIRNAGASA